MFKNKSSLYRIYRPSTFEDLAGHKNIVNILKTELLNNSFAHAFLFAGQRGTGKTSVARIFAKAVNCKELINGNPCDKCESCISANEGKSPDIFEIDAASNNGVDEIRNIKSNVNTLPILGKYKIYIIDEVHMLSKGAFNALLKTLEEPPAHALFILATTEYAKIPATIVSRCQTFNFKKIDKESLESRIEFICKNENFTIDKEAKQEIYYLSDGSLRDALNILEQLMISSTDGNITLELLKNIFYIASNKEKFNVIKNIISGNSNQLISYFENADKQGMDFDVFALSLIEMLKEIIEYKLTNNDEFIYSLSKEEINDLNVSVKELFSIADNLSDAYAKTKGTNINFNYILISVLKSIKSNEKNDVQNLTNENNLNLIEKEIESVEVIQESQTQLDEQIIEVEEKNESNDSTIEFNQDLLIIDNPLTEEKTTIIEQPIFEEEKKEPIIETEPTIEKTQIIQEPEPIEEIKEVELKTKTDLLSFYVDKIVENTLSKSKITIEIDEVINMLLGAKKEERELIDNHFKKWFEVNEDILVNPDLAKTFIVFKDAKINAVSEKEILIVCDSNSASEAIENELSKTDFREKLFKELGKEFTIYAIDNNKWNVVKADFITKKKNNILPLYIPTNPKEYYSNALNKTLEQNPESKELMEKASYLFGDTEVTIND